MPRIEEFHRNTRQNLTRCMIGRAHKLRQRLLSIRRGIQRFVLLFSCAFPLAVAPFGFKLLNMCRIHQHNVAQSCGGFGRINRTAKPVRTQKRNSSRMVNMRMGQQHRVDIARRYRHGAVFVNIPLLSSRFTVRNSPLDLLILPVSVFR